MSLELAILGFLSQRPRSGYDLKTRCFAGPLSGFWSADQAQIYRTLDRLSSDRFVAARRKKQAGRPDRKIYEITHAGREELARLLAERPSLPPTRDPFLVQLYFAHHLDDDSLDAVLEERRRHHQTRLDELRVSATDLANDKEIAPRDRVLRQTAIDGAIAQQRSAIDWLDECVDAVRAGALPGSPSDATGQRHLFGV